MYLCVPKDRFLLCFAPFLLSQQHKKPDWRGAFFNVSCYVENIYIDILNLKCAKAASKKMAPQQQQQHKTATAAAAAEAELQMVFLTLNEKQS